MQNKDDDEVRKGLEAAIQQEKKDTKKVLLILQKVRCEIRSGRNNDAVASCRESLELMKLKEFESEDEETKLACDVQLQFILKKIENTETALLLLNMRFNLVQQFLANDKKLMNLTNLGAKIQDISENINIKKDPVGAKNCVTLLDKILNEMKKVEDVDQTLKNIQISWFMKYYGVSCNQMDDYDKAVEIQKSALAHMKNKFGNNVSHYQIYGIIMHGCAVALEHTNQSFEALKMYEDAMKYQDEALDWEDDETKKSAILLTARCFQELTIKLED